MISHYRPRRRPLLERLGLTTDITDRLGWRLGIVEGDGLDVEDAVIRQDMEFMLEAADSEREIAEMRADMAKQIERMLWGSR